MASLFCLTFYVFGGFISLAFSQSNSNETLTITTYYPSPYGQYGSIQLNPRPKPAIACREGEIIYDNNVASRGLYFCNSTNQWAQLTGGGDAFWSENPATHNIYNTNSGGSIGIGTNNPMSTLAVYNNTTLGSVTNNNIVLQELNSNVSTTQYLRTLNWRNTPGSTWTTAHLYLRRNILGQDRGFIRWPAGSAGIGFGSNTNEYMRITPLGRVGIGTITPTQNLEVAGNIRVSKSIPTAAEGNITVAVDVCNGAGKCLSQIP